MSTKKNDLAEYYFHQGTNYQSFMYLGCHQENGAYVFRVWAPNADAVYLCGDFNSWDNSMKMTRSSLGGIYEYVDTQNVICEGDKYKYRIYNGSKEVMKSDPYAREMELPPNNASVVSTTSEYKWKDDGWLEHREKIHKKIYERPLNIYEIHALSWKKRADGTPPNYREIATDLAPYLKQMGYTHVELLPVTAHPYDASWGYQVGSYYAPDARCGTPDDLKAFVDIMHEAGIGVILDWVPAHFPKDAFGLYEFDGQPLYEYQGWDRMENEGWGTRRFDVGREEVQCFLVSSALFWLGEYHFDGLRVDAVTSMLYLDYDREDGQWIPNEQGGNECLEAVAFFRKLNSAVKEYFPSAITVAEESTAWKNVTSFDDGGLGFDFKWNMGWMNDTLAYIEKDPLYKYYHHDRITFPICYSFSEKYILPISHDEVVHGKRSLVDKMPGDYWQKFASDRLTFAYQMTFPGKKLTFMGNEIAQFREWDYAGGIEYFLLDYDMHSKFQLYVSDLNNFYLTHSELWERDTDISGFSWISVDNRENSVFSYRRIDSGGDELIVILNFTPRAYENYKIGVPALSAYYEIFSSDHEKYGGSGVTNSGELYAVEYSYDNLPYSLSLRVPPLGASIIKSKSENKKKNAL